MQKILIITFLLIPFLSYSAVDVSFIEFYPVAAINKNYTLGISEIKVNKKLVKTIGFRKGKQVISITPNNIVKGRYFDFDITNLAFYDDYVVVGIKEKNITPASWVFMFYIQENRVSIVDIISKSNINEYIYDFEMDLPLIDAPGILTDIDKDGIKEFELSFYDHHFTLPVKVTKKGLNLDYNSSIYKEQFKNLSHIENMDKYQVCQYLIYGALSKYMNIDEAQIFYLNYIKDSNVKLKNMLDVMEQLKFIVSAYGIEDVFTDYLRSDIEINILEEHIKNNNDRASFFNYLKQFEKLLQLLKADEIFLNDYMAYIHNEISRQDLEKSITLSVEQVDFNISSLISNIFALNNVIHKRSYKLIQLNTGM